jgi:hypothetical protein
MTSNRKGYVSHGGINVPLAIKEILYHQETSFFLNRPLFTLRRRDVLLVNL